MSVGYQTLNDFSIVGMLIIDSPLRDAANLTRNRGGRLVRMRTHILQRWLLLMLLLLLLLKILWLPLLLFENCVCNSTTRQ